MRATKIIVESAAAALLTVSFFALPMGLASVESETTWTTEAANADGGDAARTVSFQLAQAEPLAPSTPATPEVTAPPPATDEPPAPPPPPEIDVPPTPQAGPAAVLPMPSATMPPAFWGRLATRQGQAPVKPRHVAQIAAAAAASSEGSAEKKKKKKKKRPCLEPDPRITTQGGNRYAVDRDLIDRYTADLSAAAKLAWVGWHRDAQGDVDGFKVKRIRCGSVLHQAGFRNGDIVHKVNGKDVTTIPQALIAYRKLRKKRSLRVELKRKGARQELRYRLG